MRAVIGILLYHFHLPSKVPFAPIQTMRWTLAVYESPLRGVLEYHRPTKAPEIRIDYLFSQTRSVLEDRLLLQREASIHSELQHNIMNQYLPLGAPQSPHHQPGPYPRDSRNEGVARVFLYHMELLLKERRLI